MSFNNDQPGNFYNNGQNGGGNNSSDQMNSSSNGSHSMNSSGNGSQQGWQQQQHSMNSSSSQQGWQQAAVGQTVPNRQRQPDSRSSRPQQQLPNTQTDMLPGQERPPLDWDRLVDEVFKEQIRDWAIDMQSGNLAAW